MLLGSPTRGWSTSETRALGDVALGILAYGGARLVDGNPFVAAFIGGRPSGRGGADAGADRDLAEVLAGPVGFAVLGHLRAGSCVPRVGRRVGWEELAYALLPSPSCACCRWRSRSPAPVCARTMLFVGWFGPRGLASVVFALIAVEDLGTSDPRVGVGRAGDRGHGGVE